MYNFVDTTTGSASSSALPAEALQINGAYIENEIEGYRTLYVLGRELTEAEITELQIGQMDGSEYRNSRIVSRSITVGYQLLSDSPEAFREKFNTLNKILNQKEAKLIFADETDKYFIGTKSEIGDVKEGLLNVTGEFVFYCCDPYKYATTEKSFQAEANDDGVLEVIVENDGAVNVPVSYEITHNHENGYIGIVSEYGAIQLGKVQEADGESYQQNETLIDGIQTLVSAADDHGTNYMHPDHDMGGTLDYMSEEDALVIGSMGTGQAGKWCGGMRTIPVPEDSEGEAGAKNFWCYLNWYFQTGLLGQTGEQSIAFLTEDNKVICGYSLYKSDMSGNTAALEFWLNGKVIESKLFTPSGNQYENPFNGPRGNQDITKEGDRVRFYWNGIYSYKSDPAIKDMVCTKIQVAFTQYYGRDIHPWGQYVTRNYLRNLIFQTMAVDKWKDIPNRYAAGDVITIDGAATKVYRNGMNITGDEITGSKYFLAPPGETKIQFSFSDFCNPKPTVKAKIREAYL